MPMPGIRSALFDPIQRSACNSSAVASLMGMREYAKALSKNFNTTAEAL